MGKLSSQNSYPQYSGGNVSVNGRPVVTTSRKGNSINTDYHMSDMEQKAYDAVQSGMYDSVQNLFKISDNQRTEWQNYLDALKNQGVQNINDIYTPIETNLRNDIASRFGNLDNSMFMDKLNKITNKKAKSVADLSNSLALAQNDLYTNELNNRMNTISFLNNLNSSFTNNMLNFANASNANASYGNAYNNSVYNAGLRDNSNINSNLFGTSTGLNTAMQLAMLTLI